MLWFSLLTCTRTGKCARPLTRLMDVPSHSSRFLLSFCQQKIPPSGAEMIDDFKPTLLNLIPIQILKTKGSFNIYSDFIVVLIAVQQLYKSTLCIGNKQMKNFYFWPTLQTFLLYVRGRLTLFPVQ